jgi:hypothetical protein
VKHARGDWLYYRPDARAWVERLRADPEYYDAKSAGWWVWFVSCWIGGATGHSRDDARRRNRLRAGWHTERGGRKEQVPHLGDAGTGVARQRPHLGSGGQGNGVHGNVARQIPELRSGKSGVRSARATGPTPGKRREYLTAYMRQLAARLERVRVCLWRLDAGNGP